MSHHQVFNPQPIPRMRLIQEGPMPTYIGANPAVGGGGVVRDEFVEAGVVKGKRAGAGGPQAVLMPAKPVPTVAKGPKGKRAAGVSPARAAVTKKRKSLTGMVAPPVVSSGQPVMQLPHQQPGGSSVRPPNCKYRNSYPLPQQPMQAQQQPTTQTRRRRTVEDFLTFCKMILDYENYTEQEEDRKRHSSSPLGSTGSSTGSGWEPVAKPPPASSPSSELTGFKKGDDPSSSPLQAAPSSSPEHATEEDETGVAGDVEDGGWNSVTCFCKKPFAGRPMIECSECLTWVHLKCAKLSRKKIPDKWFCQGCRSSAPSPSSSSLAASKAAKGGGKAAAAASNKAKSSPAKPLAGARKRKSSLTSKRVVVITDNSSSTPTAAAAPPGDDQSAAASPDRQATTQASPQVTPVTSPAASDVFGRGEWLPRQEVAAGDS